MSSEETTITALESTCAPASASDSLPIPPEGPAATPAPPLKSASQPDPTPQNPTEPHTKTETDPPSLTPESQLNPRQLTAINLLVMGHTVTATASIVGVNRWTINAWKKDPAFAAALNRHRDDIHRTADARIRLLLLQTTQTALESLHVKDPDARYRHCFRLLSLLRPYRAALQPPEPPDEPALNETTTDDIESAK
jgi:hypothetical protein